MLTSDRRMFSNLFSLQTLSAANAVTAFVRLSANERSSNAENEIEKNGSAETEDEIVVPSKTNASSSEKSSTTAADVQDEVDGKLD